MIGSMSKVGKNYSVVMPNRFPPSLPLELSQLLVSTTILPVISPLIIISYTS